MTQRSTVLIKQAAVGFELLEIPFATCPLQSRNGSGVHVVVFAVYAPMVDTTIRKVVVAPSVGCAVLVQLLAGDVLESQSTNAAQ